MKKIFLIIGCVVVLGGGVWIYFSHAAAPVAQALPPFVVPALTKSYSNSTYNFSLKMPEDFNASEIAADPDGTPDTVVLQDTNGNGIQIAVSPFSEDTGSGYTLTQARIEQDVPDMAMSDVQSVDIGSNYRGVAFKSDNAAFGGSSREVWFVFKGNLYQISTYARLDDLLKAIFATWQFKTN